jgi:hypothetical protein
MFVIIEVFVIYLRTKFHMPTYSGSVVTTVKPEAKCIFRSAAMFIYILQ